MKPLPDPKLLSSGPARPGVRLEADAPRLPPRLCEDTPVPALHTVSGEGLLPTNVRRRTRTAAAEESPSRVRSLGARWERQGTDSPANAAVRATMTAPGNCRLAGKPRGDSRGVTRQEAGTVSWSQVEGPGVGAEAQAKLSRCDNTVSALGTRDPVQATGRRRGEACPAGRRVRREPQEGD